MTEAIIPIGEKYWQKLEIDASDFDVLSSYLLERESPLTPLELAKRIVIARLAVAEAASEKGEQVLNYLPADSFAKGQKISFSHLDKGIGKVTAIRDSQSLPGQDFKVIDIEFEDGSLKSYASELINHHLNEILNVEKADDDVDPIELVLNDHGDQISSALEIALRGNSDFVYIAGRWFLKALTADFSEGQLNLAEALLDMAAGGPLSTEEILEQVGGPDGIHPNLASFSLDLALQDDERFDEVGTTGTVAWFLRKLEPSDVQNTPLFLQYEEIPFERENLDQAMLDLEQQIHDELSPIEESDQPVEEVEVRLIFPHWRSGSLPLTSNMEKLFPTAYESPRVRFEFVDANSGDRFPGWVVRDQRYVDGLRKWYTQRELMPGSYVKVRKGNSPGEIIVDADSHHSSKEWVRTALIGADGGVVYATLKQPVQSAFDERMMVYLPSDISALNEAWQSKQHNLERVLLHSVRELTKLSPQQHAHATEIYSAVNVVKRCPPGPILSLLLSNSEIEHVGHLHFRMKDGPEV